MAAVLCRSISQLIDNIGNVICIPCQHCGGGCRTIYDKVICSPFFPYLAATALVNLPPAIRSLPFWSEAMYGGNCMEGLRWIVMNSICCFIHVAASLYIAHKILKMEEFNVLPMRQQMQQPMQQPPPQKQPLQPSAPPVAAMPAAASAPAQMYKQQSNSDIPIVQAEVYYEASAAAAPTTKTDDSMMNKKPAATVTSMPPMAQPHPSWQRMNYTNMSTAPRSMSRVKDVLCEDKGVAVYIVVFIFWVVWLTIGVGRLLSMAQYDCADVKRVMTTSIISGWIYCSIFAITFGCSLCCMS